MSSGRDFSPKSRKYCRAVLGMVEPFNWSNDSIQSRPPSDDGKQESPRSAPASRYTRQSRADFTTRHHSDFKYQPPATVVEGQDECPIIAKMMNGKDCPVKSAHPSRRPSCRKSFDASGKTQEQQVPFDCQKIRARLKKLRKMMSDERLESEARREQKRAAQWETDGKLSTDEDSDEGPRSWPSDISARQTVESSKDHQDYDSDEYSPRRCKSHDTISLSEQMSTIMRRASCEDSSRPKPAAEMITSCRTRPRGHSLSPQQHYKYPKPQLRSPNGLSLTASALPVSPSYGAGAGVFFAGDSIHEQETSSLFARRKAVPSKRPEWATSYSLLGPQADAASIVSMFLLVLAAFVTGVIFSSSFSSPGPARSAGQQIHRTSCNGQLQMGVHMSKLHGSPCL